MMHRADLRLHPSKGRLLARLLKMMADGAGTSRLRVLTQNLWGTRGAWEKRRAVLIALVREVEPDLISFQEAIKTTDYDQMADLLGPDYHIAYQRAPEPDGQRAQWRAGGRFNRCWRPIY
jgi:hypothetical protein